jgi:hypothetical protein
LHALSSSVGFIGPVRFQDVVFLTTDDGHYLAVDPRGQVTTKKVVASNPWLSLVAMSTASVTNGIAVPSKPTNTPATTTIDDKTIQWRIIPAHPPVVSSTLDSTVFITSSCSSLSYTTQYHHILIMRLIYF